MQSLSSELRKLENDLAEAGSEWRRTATKRQSRLMRGSMALQRGSIASKQMQKRMSKAMAGRMSRLSVAGGGVAKGSAKGPPSWMRRSNKGDLIWVPDKEQIFVD